MAIVEQVCRARSGGSLLHDDYSNISYIEIDVCIGVESIDCGGEYRAGREGEDLIIMAQGFSIRKKQVVSELIFQTRIEGVCWARS